jgi:hypothetical protein
MRWTALLVAGALVTVSQSLLAQEMSGHAREAQLTMLTYQRKALLAMVDSMPERLYRDKATPAQRDFAQQIQHAAGSAAYIASTMSGPPMKLPDTTTAFASRVGLESYVNAAFDYAGRIFSGQSAAVRAAPGKLFGRAMPTWQIWDEIYTHTVWTAGQIVANFRKNGMAPPAFTFF